MRSFVSGTVLALGAIAACGGQSPKACTDCAMVAGNYQITLAAGYATCGIETLTFAGADGPGELDQDGSALTLTLGSTYLHGTLHSDNSALFGPSSDTTVTDGSSPDQAGSTYLAGFFTAASGGGYTFDGTYFFIEGDNGCEVDSKSTWR